MGMSNSQEATPEMSKKEAAKARAEHNRAVNERLDKDYDGYYDDVKPMQETSRKQEVDKELIKKIALIAVVGVAIIGLAIVLMVKG